MSSRCLDRVRPPLARLASVLVAALVASPVAAQPAAPLRVCADPDNPPYSRRDGTGFENALARFVATELQRPLELVWVEEGRGHVRKTLGAGRCDLLIGLPPGTPRTLTTRPYYASSYVFVTRADAPVPLASFDDPRLAQLRIGVQLVAADLAATPPGLALARRGAQAQVVGYPSAGAQPAAARAVADLAAGRLDAALLWGPQAGWFAAHSPVAMQVAEAQAPAEATQPFRFAIAMAVGPADLALHDALDALIARRADTIQQLLREGGVPLVPADSVGAGR